jgi:membrane associated rhomboid family serine protease
VVLALIAANIAVFLLLQPASLQRGEVDTDSLSSAETRELDEHFSAWGAVPCEIKTLEARNDGAQCREDTDRPITDDKPVLASLFTSMFLHGSVLHLAVNMLFLWIFGAAVEDRFGPGQFLGLYLLGGIAGMLAYVASNPLSAQPAVGASGAISAVMGAFLLIGGRRRILSFVAPFPLILLTLPAWALLAPYLVAQFVTPDDTAVAWQAHVGGMVAGFVMAVVLAWIVPIPSRWIQRRRRTVPPPDPSTWTIPAAPPTADTTT